jgi:DNA adenine methylase
MQYMGNKNRIAKHLLPVMLPYRKPGQWWVEPFVGGGNMIGQAVMRRMPVFDCMGVE